MDPILASKDENGYINYNGDFYINNGKNRNITEIGLKLGIINGAFDLEGSNIKSFKNFPYIIKGYVDFSHLMDIPCNYRYISGSYYYIKYRINTFGKKCVYNMEISNLKYWKNNENFKYRNLLAMNGNN